MRPPGPTRTHTLLPVPPLFRSSLRRLASTDWREFVEAMSVVEKTLRDDPGATYGRMDFATRDRYRHVVERLARRGKLDECDVARGALRLAREAADRKSGV